MDVKTLCLLPVLSIVIGMSEQFETVSVDTNIGIINGLVEDVTFLGKSFRIHKFLGIPYAEPPIGKLRFQNPVPKSPLEEPLDAFKHNNVCLQMLGLFDSKRLTYDEDCLYLNIYAPERKPEDELLPVMVWIYGGGFTFGFADMYIGDHLATHGNVIVVTLNYRLSVWGFLATGDKNAPGNYGLWDQHMAIKWVHDNIAAFGGDTEKVTLFGESAGSASVMHQALYPGNKGLFQRVIGQSGSVGNFWGNNEKYSENAKHLGALAECETEDSEALVSCLREVSTDQLVEFVTNATYGLISCPFPFLPTVDGRFVSTDPKHIFDKNTDIPSEIADFFSSLDIMSGVNSGEGSLGLSPFTGVINAEEFSPNRTFFEEILVPLMIKVCIRENIPRIAIDGVIQEYTNWENPDDGDRVKDEFVSMWGDVSFTRDLYKTLDTHSNVSTNQRTYMYMFDFEPEHKSSFRPASWFKKLGHGQDLPFTFGFKNPEELEEMFHASPRRWEERLSADIMTLWTNFAKTGNPNSPEDLGLDWIPYTLKHQHYLQISRDMTSSNVKQRWNTRRANFWANLLPQMIKSARCEESKYDERQNQGTCPKDQNCSP
ncbi:cholinesterase 1-like isoform X2 [Mercenaria mercenaria]|nr:cholinesterase 1-like isoform X2 [Mercenaria mercenaria]